jgi:expansin (peptidoglycan-binding protein)
MKKTLMVMVMVAMLFTGLFVNNASATWYTCTINYAGTWNDLYVVVASEAGGAFTDTTFVLDPATGRQKEMLAVALTAMANNRQAWIWPVTLGGGGLGASGLCLIPQ